jgi:hypothetical protein
MLPNLLLENEVVMGGSHEIISLLENKYSKKNSNMLDP